MAATHQCAQGGAPAGVAHGQNRSVCARPASRCGLPLPRLPARWSLGEFSTVGNMMGGLIGGSLMVEACSRARCTCRSTRCTVGAAWLRQGRPRHAGAPDRSAHRTACEAALRRDHDCSHPDPSQWLTDLLAGQQEMFRILGGGTDPARFRRGCAPLVCHSYRPGRRRHQGAAGCGSRRAVGGPACWPDRGGAQPPVADRRFAGAGLAQRSALRRADANLPRPVGHGAKKPRRRAAGRSQQGAVGFRAASGRRCAGFGQLPDHQPRALQTALDSGGASLVEGMRPCRTLPAAACR